MDWYPTQKGLVGGGGGGGVRNTLALAFAWWAAGLELTLYIIYNVNHGCIRLGAEEGGNLPVAF